MLGTTNIVAEWWRRRPAKPMGSPRVGSNPTGVDLLQCRNGRPSGVVQRAGLCYKGRGVLASDAARWRVPSSGAARAFGVISLSLAQPPPSRRPPARFASASCCRPWSPRRRARGPRRAMAWGRRTIHRKENQTRFTLATVAILAQGTSWAVAVTQAYLHCPKIGPPWPRNALSSLLAASSLACSVASLSAFREDHLRDHYCLRSICLAEC